MVKIIILLFALVVLAYFIFSFYNSYKKKKLEQKLEKYQNLLERARRSRLIYIRALEKAENAKFQIDAIENELASIKSKLQEFRPALRNQLLELRRYRFSENLFDSDLKIIEKKTKAFFSTWKSASALKTSYNLKLDEAKILHQSFASLAEDSRGKTEIWLNDKSIVMKMYNELRSEVKISDPREVLLKGTGD